MLNIFYILYEKVDLFIERKGGRSPPPPSNFIGLFSNKMWKYSAKINKNTKHALKKNFYWPFFLCIYPVWVQVLKKYFLKRAKKVDLPPIS